VDPIRESRGIKLEIRYIGRDPEQRVRQQTLMVIGQGRTRIKPRKE